MQYSILVYIRYNYIFLCCSISVFNHKKQIHWYNICCLSILSLFGFHLPANLFYYPMAIVFYLIGAIIGYHFFNYASKKSSKPLQIISLVVFSSYILAKNIVPQEIHISNYLIETIAYTIAAFSLWNILVIFIERFKPRAIYRRSFAIYATHLNVAIVLLKILSFCLPDYEWVEIPKFLIMAVFTIIIINYACAISEKFFPRSYALFIGNRLKKD